MNEPVIRASWAAGDPLLTRYYDTEWGMPVYDEAGATTANYTTLRGTTSVTVSSRWVDHH